KSAHLHVDISNPYVNTDRQDADKWLRGFNQSFVQHGISRVFLAPERGLPFDRLQARPSEEPMPILNAPLVSVIMTSYSPDVRAFETAAKSILNQSWSKIELIIVDDATPDGAPEI